MDPLQATFMDLHQATFMDSRQATFVDSCFKCQLCFHISCNEMHHMLLTHFQGQERTKTVL